MIGKLKIAAALMIAGGLMIAFGAIAASPALAQGQPGMSWSGRVDDNVIVYIHQDHAQTQDLAGQATTHINTSFWGRLPDRPVYVTLTHWQGRGVVQLIQQPRRDNNFTAAVRIRDPQGGRSFYSFTLSWTRDRDGIGRRYRF
ncbi:MAG TPA: hypothetical protein VFW40_14395 [Capsulimonadaceae bacterium]|nr:hypothetical protein [Capsulimonadaceae bacterium]